MIRARHFRKGFRILHSVVTRRPLDADLMQSLRIIEMRWRRWRNSLTSPTLDARLHHEFNLWAELGVGEGMYNPHLRITQQALERMNVQPGERVLDLGCGAGLGSRLLGEAVGPKGRVLAMDISDRMLLRARAANAMLKHVGFTCGSSEHLPFADDLFDKALSVEAFYYFEDQEKALAELQRVLAPSGRLFVLICLYKDHQDSLATVDGVNVPVHVRSIQEYEQLFRSEGWQDVQSHEFIRQRTNGEKPDVHDRALLLSAQKPALKSMSVARAVAGALIS